MALFQHPSPLGALTVYATSRGVRAIAFERGERPAPAAPDLDLALPELEALVRRELDGYFARERRVFTLPLDLSWLAAFPLAVLEALGRTAPFGQTTTYGALAREVGKPGGARAVGQAVGHNPVPIVIPCHRVFASSGLGGYSGGLAIKRALLAIEGHPPAVVEQRGYAMR